MIETILRPVFCDGVRDLGIILHQELNFYSYSCLYRIYQLRPIYCPLSPDTAWSILLTLINNRFDHCCSDLAKPVIKTFENKSKARHQVSRSRPRTWLPGFETKIPRPWSLNLETKSKQHLGIMASRPRSV